MNQDIKVSQGGNSTVYYYSFQDGLILSIDCDLTRCFQTSIRPRLVLHNLIFLRVFIFSYLRCWCSTACNWKIAAPSWGSITWICCWTGGSTSGNGVAFHTVCVHVLCARHTPLYVGGRVLVDPAAFSAVCSRSQRSMQHNWTELMYEYRWIH